MEREQFMTQLERLLSDISETERQEALDYYEGYFDDAGPEQEAAVIRELGSPGKVAAIIKADLEESNDRYAQYTEWGYEDTRRKEPGEMPDKYTAVAVAGGSSGEETSDSAGKGEEGRGGDAGQQARSRAGEFRRTDEKGKERTAQRNENTRSKREPGENQDGTGESEREAYGSRRERGYHADRKKNNASIILILILLVFVSPLIKGTAGGILALILLLVLFPLALILLFGTFAVTLTLGGIRAILKGIVVCVGNPAAGVLQVGMGCVCAALGLLLFLLALWAAFRLLPRWIRGFTDLCQRILRGRRKGDET